MKNTLFSILFIAIVNSSYSQKIDKSKNELKSGTTTTTSSGSSSNSSSNSVRSSNSTNSGFGDLFIEGFIYLTYYSTIGNYKYETHLNNSLTKYPYFDRSSGNFKQDGDSIHFENKMRFDLENHFMYSNSSLYGNHLKAKFRPFQYLYVQGDYRELFEKNMITNENSNLSLFQFNLAYDRIRFKKFNLGWTLGATYIANDIQKAGFSYGLNTDVFAIKNISFNSAVLWSKINGLPVNSFEIRAKYHKKNYFFAFGYEYLKIASPNYNFITIGAGIYL